MTNWIPLLVGMVAFSGLGGVLVLAFYERPTRRSPADSGGFTWRPRGERGSAEAEHLIVIAGLALALMFGLLFVGSALRSMFGVWS